ncbi:hypothetical protein LF41_2274 [Lysobacter dokdonensis DS-58]|uniref:Uncharacterized protein n=2 Tax=Noviluteimonas TaxID=3382693 RepID=A0A0A2WM21_9GAMM|nr:hypothetical protein LF41_2274 [Lysobacter dokdonensis DS-58]
MESEFAFILWSLRRYQFQMAKKGFFIRGGLSVGALFVDENSVYGPALIEAYHLENKVAVNPIVVLSDDAMGLSLHHTGYYAGESSPQEEDILVGADGRFFLNYLVECVDDSDFPTVNWADLLLHKTQVESALNEYKGDLHVFAKYAWLAAYHNYFCESKKHLVGYSDQVKISSSLAATSFRRLSQVKAKKAGKA